MKVKVKILKRFIEERGGRLRAPSNAAVEVDSSVARDWVSQGKAAYAGKPPKSQPESAPRLDTENALSATSDEESDTEDGAEDIPDEFPERELLIKGGFTTIVSLKSPNARDRVKAIDGMTTAKLTKVGMAIDQL